MASRKAKTRIKEAKIEATEDDTSRSSKANMDDDSEPDKEGNDQAHYKDFSNVQPQSSLLSGDAEQAVPLKYRKLPAKLAVMLSIPRFEAIISWMPHGRSWKIHDSEGFVKNVIPQ